MIYSIYKITNKVNNKSYVGFTQDLKRRWKTHKTCKTIYRPLYNAIKKYGIDNFIFEVIYQSNDREHTLLEMEPYFIEKYNSYNKGYNCTKGGSNTNTDEHRKSISERMKNNNPMKRDDIKNKNTSLFKKGHKPKITDERNEKIRLSKLGNKNHNYGNPHAASALNKEKILCEHCNIKTNKGNYKRWHGEKCKNKVTSLPFLKK